MCVIGAAPHMALSIRAGRRNFSLPHSERSVHVSHLHTPPAGRCTRIQRDLDSPSDVDADRVRSTLKDGILTVHLPKGASASLKRIRVE